MTSVTQQIPSFVGGISQQPDQLKVPGQLNEATNVIPDVTHGLLKRPGGTLVGTNMSSYTTDSKWFHYYRDETEQYIGQIQLSSGALKMWKCSTGAAVTVSFDPNPWATATEYKIGDIVSANSKVYKATTEATSTGSTAPSHSSGSTAVGGNTWEYVSTTAARETLIKNYLKTTPSVGSITDSDLQTLTLNDFTYIANRNCTVELDATVESARPPEAYLELKKIAYANQYAVNLFDNTNLTTVNTATRVKVERVIDSSNSCSGSTAFPGYGTAPGSGGYTGPCTDTNNIHEDGYCPNVDTQIFSVTHGTVIAANNDNHGVAYTQTVTPSSGSAADRKYLYFRIATTGQALPQSDEAQPIYRCRYTTIIDLLYGGEGWITGDTVEVWMNKAKYKITVTSHSTSKVQANLGLIRPEPTSFDTKTTVTAETVLGSIRTAIVATGNFADADVQIIGNGIYITRSSGNFNISAPSGELMNVLSDSVKDIAELPRQCKHGYVIRIENSNADEDDYYVKFVGSNNRDGDGVWEECAQPGIKTTLDASKMPVQVVRQADGTFRVLQVAWDPRQVGDDVTVPEPSFVGKTINKLIFFRNRLVILSDENVILSRPGDFFNFWPKSAITYTATDNIDLSCSSEYPAIVYDAIQVNSGLVLFTKNQQFMLTTDSDVLSPLTAKINSLASYNFNFNTNPICLGTTIAWLDNDGKYTRFFEMTAVLREGEPDIFEQSKIISKKFPKGITIAANSRENSVVFFAEKGESTIYGFRYHTQGEKRVQQAWFTWTVGGALQYLCMLDDALYAIIRNGSNDVIHRFSIKLADDTPSVIDDLGTADTGDDITYRIHLDNSKEFDYTALTYDASNNWTKFTLGDGFNQAGQLAIFARSTSTDKEFNGQYKTVTTFDDSGTIKVKIPGDFTTSTSAKAFKIVLGYLYDMELTFPTMYVKQQTGENFRADTQSTLILHRFKLNLGASGVYEATLKRVGKQDYTELFESTLAGAYYSNRVGIEEEQIRTIPIYEKNENLKFTLKSTHPSPATLYSMVWEGDYTNKYYRRV